MFRLLSPVLCVILMIMVRGGAVASGQPPKTLLADRLDYLVGLRDFSPVRPLTQDRLMKLVIDLGRWGDFPKSYRGSNGGPPNCDAFVTRSSARRFVRGLIGKDLTEWSVLGETYMPKIVGNNLGWWYNNSNTMYQRPQVHITSEKPIAAQNVQVTFRLTHKQGESMDNLPVISVGSGMAIMRQTGSNWVVTSWHVTRNTHWHYESGE